MDHAKESHIQATVQIEVRLPHAWNYIRDVRKRVQEALVDASPDLRAAAMMTASELIENAVKYGESVAAAPDIVVSCRFEDGEVRIVVTNGCSDAQAIRDLEARVQQICGTEDKESLYMARLEELLADSSQSGSLGLFRIALEGQFTLHVSSASNVVEVSATRSCR